MRGPMSRLKEERREGGSRKVEHGHKYKAVERENFFNYFVRHFFL